MDRIVFVQADVAVRHNGQLVQLAKGDAWDANDSLVKAHPGLFSSNVKAFLRRTDAIVEQATANPGEKRSFRRD